MDEYVSLPEDHPESYHSFMYKHFFAHIDINPANVNILNGNATNLAAECAEYERKITRAGGIDLFLGGIGPDGHIAFNEPGSSLRSRTRVATLAEDTIRANSRFFGGDLTQVPKQALTVGVQTIMDAREVILIITGSHKSVALQKTVEGSVSQMWTASCLQMHEEAMIACDEAATDEMLVKTVKVRNIIFVRPSILINIYSTSRVSNKLPVVKKLLLNQVLSSLRKRTSGAVLSKNFALILTKRWLNLMMQN